MRLDRWIILFLLLALAAVGTYYVASQVGLAFITSTGPTIQFVLPTASGLKVGQSLAASGQPAADDIGRITEIVPIADGVLVTATLQKSQPVPPDAHVLLRPGSPPKPSILELAGGSGHATVSKGTIVRVTASVELGPPEGLVEPVPEWPLDNR